MPLFLNITQPDFESVFTQYLTEMPEAHQDIRQTVWDIIRHVEQYKDRAVCEYTARFDRLSVQDAAELRVSSDAIEEAYRSCEPAIREALELARERIYAYHLRQLPSDFSYTDAVGVTLGNRWRPIPSVGLYVPGGKASYPSSVLMNAVPAEVAGVPRRVMVVPALEGVVSPVILAAAYVAGISEVYTIGGAQAIAALAFGTESIPKVHKIVGPGNAYVAMAKQQLFGVVGIDMVAGPSEILVVADANTPAEWIAADLLSQAEHDRLARSILITADAAYAAHVAEVVEQTLQRLPRQDIARCSWESRGLIVVAPDRAQQIALVNRIAPEHLELAIADAEVFAEHVDHAGALFLGRYTPEAIGDYMAGPSHVLPTSGTAVFSSGLSVFDFLKRQSLIGCSREGFQQLAKPTATLAHAEGLGAHALSVEVRM